MLGWWLSMSLGDSCFACCLLVIAPHFGMRASAFRWRMQKNKPSSVRDHSISQIVDFVIRSKQTGWGPIGIRRTNAMPPRHTTWNFELNFGKAFALRPINISCSIGHSIHPSSFVNSTTTRIYLDIHFAWVIHETSEALPPASTIRHASVFYPWISLALA